MLSDLYKETSIYDDIKLLTIMACKLYIPVLSFRVIDTLDIQRLCNPVLEGICKIEVGHAMSIGNFLPLSCTCDGEGFEGWAVTFDDIGNIDTQSKSTAIDESEVQVPLS